MTYSLGVWVWFSLVCGTKVSKLDSILEKNSWSQIWTETTYRLITVTYRTGRQNKVSKSGMCDLEKYTQSIPPSFDSPSACQNIIIDPSVSNI